MRFTFTLNHSGTDWTFQWASPNVSTDPTSAAINRRSVVAHSILDSDTALALDTVLYPGYTVWTNTSATKVVQVKQGGALIFKINPLESNIIRLVSLAGLTVSIPGSGTGETATLLVHALQGKAPNAPVITSAVNHGSNNFDLNFTWAGEAFVWPIGVLHAEIQYLDDTNSVLGTGWESFSDIGVDESQSFLAGGVWVFLSSATVTPPPEVSIFNVEFRVKYTTADGIASSYSNVLRIAF